MVETPVDVYADLLCPLPVLRFTWPDDPMAERGPLAVHHCGSPLHVEHTRYNALLAGGEMEISAGWRVICEGGHTLLLPDDEDNDNLDQLIFDVALVQEALEGIGVVAKGGGGLDLRDVEAVDRS
jgi:hypothetical protein